MFTLSIVTQEKVLFDQEVASVIAPGSEGYLGILTNHAPLITALVPGQLTVKDSNNNETYYAVSGGFLEVSGNVATILADTVEPTQEIDIKRAEEAIKRCRERLDHKDGVDIPRALIAKRRAENRLKVYRDNT
ncbi:MAG: ATP synthase F1 subunit epsilon [candidate division Zixibacteria bacterium]|nr:ATP synthase F1 subunit epsilon [candidate division Zixibacteria bacterium]